MARILLLNGPNLNLLGSREPGVYGADTLEAIVQRCTLLARELGHELVARQSNAEH
jgi:3-dehydroquinate dehydratase-2